MAQALMDKKSATEPVGEDTAAAATRPRWSLKRFLSALASQLTFALLFYAIVYPVRHWFDFFCYPWTFDDIFMGQHVPYPVSAVVFGGVIAWSRKYQSHATFWRVFNFALATLANEVYLRPHEPEITTWPFSLQSVSACAMILWSAALGECGLKLERDDVSLAERLPEDPEAARGFKSVEARVAPAQALHTNNRSRIGSLTAYMSDKLPTLRTAVVVALAASAATAIKHPPPLADEYLSYLNCKAQFTKLDFDNQHFEFAATNKTGPFARSCSEQQQLITIERIMTSHVTDSDATCGVWCLRRAEDGQLFGYISQVRGGLVDMYYCRGGYGSFGPDCEAEGEDYGYDVGKEGWMDDIFEPWNVLEEDTGDWR